MLDKDNLSKNSAKLI